MYLYVVTILVLIDYLFILLFYMRFSKTIYN